MHWRLLDDFVQRDLAGLSVRFDGVDNDVRGFRDGDLLCGVRAFQDDDEAVFALLKAVYVMSVEQDMRRCVAGCRGDADERAATAFFLRCLVRRKSLIMHGWCVACAAWQNR